MKVYIKLRNKWVLVKGWLKQSSTKTGKKTSGYSILGEESEPPDAKGLDEVVIPAYGFSRLLSKILSIEGEGVVLIENLDVENLRVRARREILDKIVSLAKELKIIE
ncbi:hypothetical protein ACSU1N_01790 [Thermogladius sp. 4427co]|uniref:hypothetical protein n=1 Tax=Thermogladius sp. 4427co TaxID=3450718 RepID=UPI003F7A5A93